MYLKSAMSNEYKYKDLHQLAISISAIHTPNCME